MNDDELKVFIDGVAKYFETITNTPATIETPFLIKDINEYLLDYTGIIGISGNYKGSVFFTAPETMLRHIMSAMGLLSSEEKKLMDLVGEVSNTISGNARSEFGDQFMLSVPIVLKGKSDDLKVSKVVKIYVIPLSWKHLRANLIINLE